VVEISLRTPIDRAYWHGKTVLVTGHTGFKGSWLTLWLKELGCNVIGVSLEPPTNPSLFELAGVSKFCESYIIDIRDEKKLFSVFMQTQPEIVFHLAANSLVRESYFDPIKTFSTNTMGTANVLESLRLVGSVNRAVMVTTDKVYRDQVWLKPYTEQDVLGGHDPYSASKSASELIIDCYRNAFLKSQGVNIASARAGNVIGGGDWAKDRIIPDAIRAWGGGQALKVRHPESIRPWQHVLEPLYGYIILAQMLGENSHFDGSFNFGPNLEDVATVKQVINVAQKIWGSAQVEWGNESGPLKETTLLMLDSSKSQRELGVKPIWNIAQAVERTMTWYKNQAQGVDPLGLCINNLNEFEAISNKNNE